MAANTYKIPGKPSPAKGRSFFAVLDRILPVNEALAQVIHIRFLPQIFFILVICVLYIGSRHYAEKRIRAISKLEIQVEDLRADYTTLKADYNYASKQSEVARAAASLGLKESTVSPYKIIIPEE